MAEQTKWYPYEQLGPMYVHTNYRSFQSNVGSFGDHTGILQYELQEAIKMQKEREERIDALMKETFGKGIDDFLDFIKDWFTEYGKHAGEAWINNEIRGAKKYGSMLNPLFNPNLQEGLGILQEGIDSIFGVVNELLAKGYIEIENMEKVSKNIKQVVAKIESQIGDATGSAEETGITRALTGAVYNLKGLVWEVFIMAVISTFLKTVGNIEGCKLIATGYITDAKSDAMLQIEQTNLGISIKSTSEKVFKQHGVYVHHGTLNSILSIMESFSKGSYQAIRDAKYYLINISRMKGAAMTAQQGSTDLRNLSDGYTLIRDLMSTYMTVFIGGSHFPDSGDIDEDVKQADVLITQDRAFRKSTILEGLLKDDFASYLKINYSVPGDSFWKSFDDMKRGNLKATKGDYGNSSLLAQVRPVATKLLSQTASVRLRLLMK